MQVDCVLRLLIHPRLLSYLKNCALDVVFVLRYIEDAFIVMLLVDEFII